jgi:hypothetical protein
VKGVVARQLVTLLVAVVTFGVLSAPVAQAHGGRGSHSQAARAGFTLDAAPETIHVQLDDTDPVTATYGLTLASRRGWTGPVTVTASGLPSGAAPVFSPPGSTAGTGLITVATTGVQTGTLTVSVPATTTPGTYPIHIDGAGPGAWVRASDTVRLVVRPPSPLRISYDVLDPLIIGEPAPLDLVLTNTGSRKLYITDLTVELQSVTPPACGPENFGRTQLDRDLDATPLVLEPLQVADLTDLGVPQAQLPTITFLDLPTPQPVECLGATFTLRYSATVRVKRHNGHGHH